MDSEQDDWLIKSLTMYDNVWMYELQDATRCLSWLSEKELVVASCAAERQRNEIVELVMADTLFARHVEAAADKQVASAKRDFKLQRGSFTDHPVQCMTAFQQQRLLATSGNPNGQVNLWMAEEGKGSFTSQPTGKLSGVTPSLGGCPLLSAAPASSHLLAGHQSNCVVVSDVNAGQTLWKHDNAGLASERLGSLCWLDRASVFYSCLSSSGQVSLWDVRCEQQQQPRTATVKREECSCRKPPIPSDSNSQSSPHAGQVPAAGHQMPRSIAAASTTKSSDVESVGRHRCVAAFSGDSQLLASLCSGGDLQLFDSRSLKSPLAVARNVLRHPPAVPSTDGLQLQFSPTNSDLLSVSGVGVGVDLVSLKTLTGGTDSGSSSPVVFTHDGHAGNSAVAVSVLSHSWHATEANLLFSSASDGSLHAWKPTLPP